MEENKITKYTFEQDVVEKGNNNNDNKNEMVDEKTLPKPLQMALAHQPPRNKFFKAIEHVMGAYDTMMFLSLLLESAGVGITIGIFSMLLNIVIMVVEPDIGKDPALKKVLYANIDKLNSVAIKHRKQSTWMFLIFLPLNPILFIAPGIVALTNPKSSMLNVFGTNTSIMIYGMFATRILQLISKRITRGWFGPRFIDSIIPLNYQFTERITKDYLKTVRDAMLAQLNLENGNKVFNNVFHEDISIAHLKFEKDGSEFNNYRLALFRGMRLITLFFLSVCFIILSFVLQMTNQDGSNTWKIAILTVFSCLLFFVFLTSLNNFSKQNKIWTKESNLVLNDPLLQYRIKEMFGSRASFKEWLDSHELSAARVFGIKFTRDLLLRFGTGCFSAFTIVLYLLIREELQQTLL